MVKFVHSGSSQCPKIETVFWRRISCRKTGHHPEHTWSRTVRVRKVTNSSIIFPTLNVVCCRNVELTTLNIALLRRQPKYCEITFSFELALFSIFSIAFWYIFSWNSYFCLFFMSLLVFSRILKGARKVTKGCTYSLECERVKFVFKKKKTKKPLSILSGTQQRRTLRRCVASITFLWYTFLVRSGVVPYAAASPFFHLLYVIAKSSMLLRRHSSLLHRALRRDEYFGPYKYLHDCSFSLHTTFCCHFLFLSCFYFLVFFQI